MIRRLSPILGLLAVGACIGFMTAHRAAKPQKQTDAAILSARISRVSVGSPTCRDAIEYIRQISKANIAVDWQTMMDANFRPESHLTLDLKLRDVTLEQLLDTFTKCSERDGVRLVWSIHDGIIEFSAAGVETLPAAAEDTLVTLDYDVFDLVTRDGAWERCANALTDDPLPAAPLSVDQRAQLLIRTLSRIRAPYRIPAEVTGSATIHWGRLVVTESRENQQATADMLRILREAR